MIWKRRRIRCKPSKVKRFSRTRDVRVRLEAAPRRNVASRLMDRRAFLIMALAGAADSGSAPTPPPATRVALAPPEPAALSGDAAFRSWSQVFIGRAIMAGLPAEVVTREMTGLAPDPRVASLDTKQPEFAKPISDYIRGVISDDRIAAYASSGD